MTQQTGNKPFQAIDDFIRSLGGDPEALASLPIQGMSARGPANALEQARRRLQDIGWEKSPDHLWDLYVGRKDNPVAELAHKAALIRIGELTGTVDPVRVEVLNARKNQWQSQTISRADLETWRNTPGRIHLVRDYKTEARGELDDFDNFTGGVWARVLKKGALLEEGVVTEARLVGGKAEYLLKPHTKTTRKQYEAEQKRQRVKSLEQDLRADVDYLMPQERRQALQDEIQRLRAELSQ